MKTIIPFLALLLLSVGVVAQENVRIVDDEECGCELYYIDGIETTRNDDLYGFRREDGTVIVPNIYRMVDHFHGAYCKVMMADTLCGLIDSTGREVLPCIYTSVDYPSEGRILVQKGAFYGYTDLDGEVVIPIQYLAAGNFSEGCAAVTVPLDSFFSACTFIDTLGHQLFPPRFESVSAFAYGLAMVMQYQRWGLIDHTGNIVLPTVYDYIVGLADTLFFASSDEALALFDARMKPLTKYIYNWTSGLHEGRIGVMRDDKYGFLDRQGREVVPCIYDATGIFSSGRTMVQLNGKYGIIDTNGRIVLPIEYDDRVITGSKYYYSDGLSLVEKDGKAGYVDLEGNLVIPFYFDNAYEFSEGLASVRHKGRWGYVDTKGEVFLPFIFDLASPYQWGRAEVYYNGVPRKVDRKGRCVKNCNGIIAWRDWTE